MTRRVVAKHAPDDPICRAIATVVAAAHERFEPLIASLDPAYAEASAATDPSAFATGGTSNVPVPNATTSITADYVVGSFSATFADATAGAFDAVSASAAGCATIARWKLAHDEPNDVEWYTDVQYETGPPRRIEVRVNRMLASDPLALEPKEDALWLTIDVSPAPLH